MFYGSSGMKAALIPLAMAAALLQGEAQTDDATTRQLVAEEFVEVRPPGQAQAARKPGVRASLSESPPQLGMTLWVLRRPKAADEGVRMLVQEDGRKTEWIPERVSSGSLLRQGDRVRLSFESARKGYLYVIDREVYSGNKLGDPYLIFPTKRMHGGNNFVQPGRLIELPGQDDQPNYLTVHRDRSDQEGEWLGVIISPKPLSTIPVGAQPVHLSAETVAQWQGAWGTQTEAIHFGSRKEQVWTRAEQEAGANRTRLLTQDDPEPETIFRASTAPNRPLLVTVRLQYAAH